MENTRSTPKIVEYDIIYYENSRGLANLVADAIVDGWQPLGGIGIRPQSDFCKLLGFYQAMVKYEN